MVKGSDIRTAEHPIYSLFLDRWSPRAMSGEAVSNDELFRLFEAAHWAPSSGNSQPWRFLYARRATEQWPRFLDLLVEANRVWCVNAGALVVIASCTTRESTGAPLPTPSFDTGAAWAQLALQGWLDGLVVHGMAGFDYARARQALHVPEDYRVEAMVAIGRPGARADLPDSHRDREIPSLRRPVRELVFEGGFQSAAPQKAD
jgi:nitroreductase